MQLLDQIWIQVVLAAAVWPLVYMIFAAFEDRMPAWAKARAADAARIHDREAQPNVASADEIFQWVFSPRHFSLRCAGAVLAVSAIAYLLTVLSIRGMRDVLLIQPAFYLTEVMPLSLVINFVAVFGALAATRALVERSGTASGLKTLALFALDTGIKCLLVWVMAYFSLSLLGAIEGWRMSAPGVFIQDILDAEPAVFVSIFTPLLLSSLWIWIYAGCRALLPRLASLLRWLLDFETHPVRSLGVATATANSVLAFVVLVATALVGGA